jgi:hypothetical protein
MCGCIWQWQRTATGQQYYTRCHYKFRGHQLPLLLFDITDQADWRKHLLELHGEGLIPDFERGIYASVVVDAKIVPSLCIR